MALAAAQTNPDESTFDEPGKKVGTSNWTRKKSVPPMTSAMVMDTEVNRQLEPDNDLDNSHQVRCEPSASWLSVLRRVLLVEQSPDVPVQGHQHVNKRPYRT